MRPGMIIKFKNDLHSVFSIEHRTPGNLRAFIQRQALPTFATGASFTERFPFTSTPSSGVYSRRN